MDGFIAGPDGDLSWLEGTPNPTNSDLGYSAFMESIDAIVMGRKTFDTVVAFGGDWPYTKPIIVLSSSLQQVPDKAVDTELSTSAPTELVEELAARGMTKLYIDGGQRGDELLAGRAARRVHCDDTSRRARRRNSVVRTTRRIGLVRSHLDRGVTRSAGANHLPQAALTLDLVLDYT